MFGITIEDLSRGERLFLLRRRLGETQAQTAKRHGLGLVTYSKMERFNLHFPGEIPKIETLADYEFCVIARRRKKVKQRDLTAELKVCKLWLVMMETGRISAEKLVKFWEEVYAKEQSTATK